MTTRDVHSLLRWAPRSRAVVVFGELAGIGAATLERLVRNRAPGVPVVGGDTPLNGKLSKGRAAASNGPLPISKGHLALA